MIITDETTKRSKNVASRKKVEASLFEKQVLTKQIKHLDINYHKKLFLLHLISVPMRPIINETKKQDNKKN